jgi:IS30 family transposase
MADHKRFSLATDIKVYFCDPQSPWQRGSNEQINGLLRQYFRLNGSYCVRSRRLQHAFYARLKVASRPIADIQVS